MKQLLLIKFKFNHFVNSLCLSKSFEKYNCVFVEMLGRMWGKLRFRVNARRGTLVFRQRVTRWINLEFIKMRKSFGAL